MNKFLSMMAIVMAFSVSAQAMTCTVSTIVMTSPDHADIKSAKVKTQFGQPTIVEISNDQKIEFIAMSVPNSPDTSNEYIEILNVPAVCDYIGLFDAKGIYNGIKTVCLTDKATSGYDQLSVACLF